MDALKYKVINDYNQLFNYLEVGHLLDYSHILNLINFISLHLHFNSSDVLKQKLLNQHDTAYLYFGKPCE